MENNFQMHSIFEVITAILKIPVLRVMTPYTSVNS